MTTEMTKMKMPQLELSSLKIWSEIAIILQNVCRYYVKLVFNIPFCYTIR